jgi:hypothetical protein
MKSRTRMRTATSPEESVTTSRDFQAICPSHPCRLGKHREFSLDKLIDALTRFLMRQESCFSILENAVVKARQTFQTLNFKDDVSLVRRAKYLKPCAFAELLSQRSKSQNLLSCTSEALVA